MGKPKIRFKGYEDDWEQRKLSDIYASIGNAFVGTATPYYVESGHFYLESNNIKDGQINHNSEIFINDEFYEKQKDKWLHTGDMVMVQSGHVGHAAVIPEELDNSAAHALIMFRHPKEKIEPYFLNYQYQTNKSKKKIEEITTGNTIKHILASDMQEFVVDITNYDEQKKIGSYFQKLDHLITLHQRKCYRFIDIALDAWEQRKWIDVVDISTEMVNPTTGEYDNMPHIAPGNIESFTGRILDNVKTVKEEQLISGKFRFRPDDVVYGKINPQLGKYFYATVNGLTSADAYVFNGKNGLKQKFLFALLQTSDFFKYSVSVSKRSGMPKINRDELNAYSFLMPSEEEQDRIGSYLLQLDHLITLHQRKCYRFIDIALDAWEQRKLKDYLEVSREKNKTESYGKEDVLSVSGEHGIVNQIEFQGRSFAGVSVANYGVVEAGDVVYTKSPLKSNPYGIIKTNKGKTGIVSTLYAVYKPRMNTNSEFVQIYFELDSRMNSYMHPLVNKGAKNDMKVSDENALKGPVAFPELEEQNAITQYFDKLDRLITLHQRKCEETKSLKKYMLQKMFPENGNCVPKIRFSGFADAWEQRKLGEVAQEFKSGNSLKADEIDITGDYPVYGGNGLRGYTSTYNHDGEYALIGRQGALCGNMNYSVGKAYFTEHAVVVKADENNDTRFLYYMLDTMNLGQYSDQSAQPGLAVNKLVKLENQFPMKEEQQRIGWYFSNIDHLITLHQHKCDELQKLKKFMLQNMFV